MKGLFTASSAALTLASGTLAGPVTSRSELLIFKPLEVTTDSVHNVHVDYSDDAFEGDVRVVYGGCQMASLKTDTTSSA